MDNFNYIDESINDNLKCDICKEPLIDPVSLPCEQTFCLGCIKDNLQDHSNNCSQCNKKTLTNEDLKVEGPRIRRQLNQLRVKCRLCQEKNIQRSHFIEHLQESCPKRNVLCPANDIKCLWNGSFDQLHEHTNICLYEKLRDTLTELINDNQDFQQLKIDFKNIENKSEEQQKQIEQIENENKNLTKEIEQFEQLKKDNQHLTEQLNQQTTEINQLNQQTQQQINEINQLKNENQSLNQQINQIEQLTTEHQHLTEQVNEQTMEINQLNQPTDKIKQLENENKTLNEQTHQQLNQIDQLTNENQTLNQEINQIEQLKSDNENLIKQSEEQLNERNYYKNQYEIIFNEFNQFKHLYQFLKEKENHFNFIQLNNQALQQYLQEQQKLIYLFNQQNIDLQKKINSLENTENDNQILNTKIDSLNKQNQQFQQQIQILENIQNNYQILKDKSIQDQLKIEQLNIDIKRSQVKLNKTNLQSTIGKLLY